MTKITSSEYQALVGMMSATGNYSEVSASAHLAKLGLEPESWPRTPAFTEQAEMLGLAVDFGDLRSLANEWGWSDLELIKHWAVGRSNDLGRTYILLQQHELGETTVLLYVYRSDNVGEMYKTVSWVAEICMLGVS